MNKNMSTCNSEVMKKWWAGGLLLFREMIVDLMRLCTFLGSVSLLIKAALETK